MHTAHTFVHLLCNFTYGSPWLPLTRKPFQFTSAMNPLGGYLGLCSEVPRIPRLFSQPSEPGQLCTHSAHKWAPMPRASDILWKMKCIIYPFTLRTMVMFDVLCFQMIQIFYLIT